MVKNFRRSIVAMFLAAVASSAANASPTTYIFSGVIIDSYPDAGKTVTGRLTVDPASLPIVNAVGTTYSEGYETYYPPYSSPLQVSGSSSIGGVSFNTIGNGGTLDFAGVVIAKNYGSSHIDSFHVYGQSRTSGESDTLIQLFTQATSNGVIASGVFGNADYSDPDLSYGQAVNWFSVGSINRGSVRNSSDIWEVFELTSMTVTVESIPTPATLALFGLGLAGLAASRRRKQ